MAKVERLRKVRSVTLEDAVVGAALRVGAEMMPPEKNLSRLIDRALAEFVVRHAKPAKKK